MTDYASVYAKALADSGAFWLRCGGDRLGATHNRIDIRNAPFHRWFPDGEMNLPNAVDRHVAAGRGEQNAIIYDSPITGTAYNLTFAELKRATARFAGMLSHYGVGTGDRVIIYMPMIPEAVIAMLGCARLGAVHSVVFGGFAAAELAKRIDDCQPGVIISSSCGHEPKELSNISHFSMSPSPSRGTSPVPASSISAKPSPPPLLTGVM